ncbi:MAG TPA: hypothetical protein V6C69_07800 [Trichormus sp.]|jgi:membrane protein CcdC involved in cytochrome C biogenesis
MQAIAYQRGGMRFRWLFSKTIDLSIFYLPVLLGILACALVHADVFSRTIFFSFLLFQGFGLADFHIGATWFHYLDRRNWHFYTQSSDNRLNYLFIPLAWIVATAVAQIFIPKLVFSLFIIWTIQHLVQQNVGILLLHHNDGDARVERNLEVRTQHWTAIAFSLLFVRRLMPHNHVYELSLQALIAVSSIVAVVFVVQYIGSLRRQARAGATINLPALFFWIGSALFILPTSFVGSEMREALLIPQMVHWFQYVGLNFVLVSRKYKAGATSTELPMAKPIAFFLLTGATVAAAMMLGYWIVDVQAVKGTALNLIVGALYGIGFAHYWQDAFIWKFREPFNRQMMLPFLKPAAANASSPPQNVEHELVGSGTAH